jgi:hypothetical protein
LVLPVLVVLAASSVLGALGSVALAGRPAVTGRRGGWAFCAGALLAVFALQESAEGVLASGHPGGLAALAGHRGWLAVPIAIVVGRVVSLLLESVEKLELALAESAPPPSAPRAPAQVGRPRLLHIPARASLALAFGFARRPPPLPTGHT